MKPLPLELRLRIVAAVDQQEHTKSEIAVLFNVSERYVYQLLKLRRETGDLAPLLHGGGAVLKLDEAKLLKLADLVAEFPDATLDELRVLLRRRSRLSVCLNTVWRGLQQIDFTRKKKSRRAREASPAERAAFGEKQTTFPLECCWFLDEFGVHLAMSRAYARAPRGSRAVVIEPFQTGANISVISALTLDGVRAPMMIEGALDGEALELYVRHLLVPLLRPGHIVIWDNVPTHKRAQVLALITATGARVEPLPAYSPDFNPKEECISKVKAELKRIKADTKRKLQNALKRAYAKVTLSDIRGWFQHCGYSVA